MTVVVMVMVIMTILMAVMMMMVLVITCDGNDYIVHVHCMITVSCSFNKINE